MSFHQCWNFFLEAKVSAVKKVKVKQHRHKIQHRKAIVDDIS